MTTHTKKVLRPFFEALLSGKKSYELRLNNFEINEGDTLVLLEQDETGTLTGRQLEKIVTYVRNVDLNNSHWPVEEILQKGLKIISLK